MDDEIKTRGSYVYWLICGAVMSWSSHLLKCMEVELFPSRLVLGKVGSDSWVRHVWHACQAEEL